MTDSQTERIAFWVAFLGGVAIYIMALITKILKLL